MQEIEYVTLEDGLEYVVIDEIESSDTTYVYLSNADDEKDFCIRKLDKTKNPVMINGLDSDIEFDKALLLFTKKHKDDDLTTIEE